MERWTPGPQMKLLVANDPNEMDQADHVLLYLNRATWADDARRDALTEEMRALLQYSRPRRMSRISIRRGSMAEHRPPLPTRLPAPLPTRLPLLLVHEADEQRGGVETFGYFFGNGVTPAELVKLGIYTEIAIPMKAGAYRSVSCGLLDQALRAEQSGTADPSCLRRLASLCHGYPRATHNSQASQRVLQTRPSRGASDLREIRKERIPRQYDC